MEDIIYILKYKYNEDSHYIYKTFKECREAIDYYLFMKNNFNLFHIELKCCKLITEVLLCGK